MKSKILLLAVSVAAFSSCTTSYKTGQTPDDVYYSPVRPEEEYVSSSNPDSRQYRSGDDSYYEDQYLRMKVRNRYRWNDIEDPYYYSNRYNYTSYYNSYFGNPWTPYTYWNTYYNPYCHGYVYTNVNPKAGVTYNAPRYFNLSAYNNTALTQNYYSSPKYVAPSGGHSYYDYSNSGGGSRTKQAPGERGNALRQIFRSSDNNSGNNNTYSNGSSNNNSSNNSSSSGSSSSSSSSSSSGSSGSSAPVRRF